MECIRGSLQTKWHPQDAEETRMEGLCSLFSILLRGIHLPGTETDIQCGEYFCISEGTDSLIRSLYHIRISHRNGVEFLIVETQPHADVSFVLVHHHWAGVLRVCGLDKPSFNILLLSWSSTSWAFGPARYGFSCIGLAPGTNSIRRFVDLIILKWPNHRLRNWSNSPRMWSLQCYRLEQMVTSSFQFVFAFSVDGVSPLTSVVDFSTFVICFAPLLKVDFSGRPFWFQGKDTTQSWRCSSDNGIFG